MQWCMRVLKWSQNIYAESRSTPIIESVPCNNQQRGMQLQKTRTGKHAAAE
jgi:hypothetical protein